MDSDQIEDEQMDDRSGLAVVDFSPDYVTYVLSFPYPVTELVP